MRRRRGRAERVASSVVTRHRYIEAGVGRQVGARHADAKGIVGCNGTQVISTVDREAHGIARRGIAAGLDRRGFVFNSGETRDAILEGVTIRNARAWHAAGLFCEAGASPTIRDCIFEDNRADAHGGAIRSTNSTLLIIDCEFIGNAAPSGGGGGLDLARPGFKPPARNASWQAAQVAEVPHTINGKKVEVAVTRIINGQDVANRDALANPEALDLYRDLPELRR